MDLRLDLDYADALLQRNGAGDRQKAMTLLEESLAISREVGAPHGAGTVPAGDFAGVVPLNLVPLAW